MGRKRKVGEENGDGGAMENPGAVLEQRHADKRDRFLRLAPRRVQKAMKALDAVARLGNRQSYEYTEEESRKIATAINDATEACLRELSGVKKNATVFTL